MPAGNSTFAIGGVSCSADSLVVAESFVLRIKFSGKNPAHRKSATRYVLSDLVPDRNIFNLHFVLNWLFCINFEKKDLCILNKK
jgi:hypothetical protein